MKKILSSVVLILTAMLLCCGCESEDEKRGREAAMAAARLVDEARANNENAENYADEPVETEIEVTVVPKRDNNKVYDDSQCIKINDCYIGTITGYTVYNYDMTSSGFIVDYSFTNTTDSTSKCRSVAGELKGYQNGIELDSVQYGEYNDCDNVLPGSTLELTVVFITDDYDTPVEVIAENLNGVHYHAELKK